MMSKKGQTYLSAKVAGTWIPRRVTPEQVMLLHVVESTKTLTVVPRSTESEVAFCLAGTTLDFRQGQVLLCLLLRQTEGNCTGGSTTAHAASSYVAPYDHQPTQRYSTATKAYIKMASFALRTSGGLGVSTQRPQLQERKLRVQTTA